jgi:hypothetical protein
MGRLTPSSWTFPARGRCDHELLGTSLWVGFAYWIAECALLEFVLSKIGLRVGLVTIEHWPRSVHGMWAMCVYPLPQWDSALFAVLRASVFAVLHV